ncbi:MAG: hypothetical protein P4L50_14125 [Anaerolineaceae bacterium]|nr:hypothetical protein [Anaerolineaceae bacterium]
MTFPPSALLILKLILTPVLIALVTWVGRRWGPSIGGWLMGFPLTSGPVSALLALQYGHTFAARAAVGTMAGQASDCVFCLVYCLVSQFTGWPLSVLAAIVSFFVSIFIWNGVQLSLLLTFAIVVLNIGVVFWLLPGRTGALKTSITPRWDLPARMLAAAAFVVLLTTFANSLGARLSGLLTPFPLFTMVIAVFTHHQQGPAAAAQLLRGVVMGGFAFATFFLVVSILLPGVSMGWTYLAATAAALILNGIALRFVQPRQNPLPA